MADYTNINKQADMCYRLLMNKHRSNTAKIIKDLENQLRYEPSNRVLTEALYITKSRNGFTD